jgi:hypothetical protein
MSQGKIVYVPQSLWDEAEAIRVKKGLPTKTAAFNEIANYSLIGRKAEEVFNVVNLFGPVPVRKKK